MQLCGIGFNVGKRTQLQKDAGDFVTFTLNPNRSIEPMSGLGFIPKQIGSAIHRRRSGQR